MVTIEEVSGGSHGGTNKGGGGGAGGNGQTTLKLSHANFLIQLYKIVDDKTTDSIISWSSTCNTFIICDEPRFTSEILPCYFKIDRFDSFAYQLNNHGFKKKEGGRFEFEFEHDDFQEGNQHLLNHIKTLNQPLTAANNMPTLGVDVHELENLFAKVRQTQNQMKSKIHRFKDDIGKSLSDVKTIIQENSHKLISNGFEGRKRKLVNLNRGTDFVDMEKYFESMCDQLDMSPTHIDGFMALSDLTDKMVNDHNDHDGGGGGVGDGRCVPQFLLKLYDMVEKEEIDSLVSWNLPYRDSFIIGDINNFATQVLPMYFKHTNFSSFSTQLSIYGFRKISWKRHEYANEWFQGGRCDLLANIKRRDKNPLSTRSSVKFSQVEVEMLKDKLKSIEQEQENKIICISNYQEELKSSVHEFKETVINMANIVNKMILTSNENLENIKKPKMGIENNVIGNIEEQELDVDERGVNNMASTDNGDKNNVEAQAYFLDLDMDLEAMRKNMEMEYSWIVEREMDQYLTFCLGRESDNDKKFILDDASCS